MPAKGTDIKISKLGSWPRGIITFSLTVLIFIFLFSNIDFLTVLRAIARTDPLSLAIASALSLIAIFQLGSYRWRLILSYMGRKVKLGELAFIRLGSFPIANLIPFKAGLLTRCVYLKKKQGVPFSIGTISIFLELLLNLLAYFFFISIGYLLVRGFSSYPLVIAAVLLFMLICAALKFAAGPFGLLIKGFRGYFRKDLTGLAGLEGRISFKRAVNLFFCSVLYNLLDLIIFYLIFKAYGLELGLNSLLLAGSLTMLAGELPITIAGMGIREAAILFFFSHYASRDILLSAGLSVSFVHAVFPAMIGLVFTRSFLDRVAFGEADPAGDRRDL